MKYNQGPGFDFSRWFSAIFVVGMGCAFLGFGVWMLLEEEWIGLLFILCAIFWLCVMSEGIYAMAGVTLSNDGVFVRVLFKTKHYSWDEIIQAGIIWRRIKYGHVNELVLLPHTGTIGDPKDRFFMLRNRFQLIHLPCTPETVSFVVSQYGLLDFDYSNGKEITKC